MTADMVQVLGVPIDGTSEAEVLQFVADRVQSRVPSQIATVNAEFVMHARRNAEFRDAMRTAELRTADSAGVLFAARRRGLNLRKRVGGSDLIWSISEQAARLGHSIFLLGAAPGVAEEAAAKLSERYPELHVAGFFPGSPVAGLDIDQIKLIKAAKPDILFVAFGAPHQEIWVARVKNDLAVPVIMGVGGSFDYVAGIARRAPRWMQNAGLDWLYRLIRQPWRWRRMLVLPRFAWLAATRSD